MTENTYNVIKPDAGVPVKAWTKGVPLEDAARQQLLNVAQLPFIYKWVAAMPDVHWGIGATVGSVIPTRGAIIPAAVGVDIDCGMMAVKTSLHANQPTCTASARRLRKRCRTDVPTTVARTIAALGRMPLRITRKCGRRWSLRIRRSSTSIRS
jgi:RNA-splicing ligase RtcB